MPQTPQSKLTINQGVIDRFIKDKLAPKFKEACEAGVEILQDVAPIDTGRLFFSIRVEDPEIRNNRIETTIVLGGIELPGVFKEQYFSRPVDYVMANEARRPFIRPNIPEVGDAIVARLKRKQNVTRS